jgi:IclR family pca regulon transcriptional regulator
VAKDLRVQNRRTAPLGRNDFVQSFERGLAVIKAFGPNGQRLTLTEVAQATGLTRAAARRFLLTLVELGYVRSDGREFSLRPRILELGYAYLSGLSFAEVAQPFLEELAARVQESTSVAVLDEDEIVYVAHKAPRRPMTINVPIGGRDPAFCTSLGRVLLAGRPDEEVDGYLARVKLFAYTENTETNPKRVRQAVMRAREQGYALVNGEFEDGLVALAVPIRDSVGNVVAAVNISAYSLRAGPEVLENTYLSLLRDAARRIELEMQASVQLNGAAS